MIFWKSQSSGNILLYDSINKRHMEVEENFFDDNFGRDDEIYVGKGPFSELSIRLDSEEASENLLSMFRKYATSIDEAPLILGTT